MLLLRDSMAINVYFSNCFQPSLLLIEVFTLQNDVALKILGGSFLACSFQNFSACLFRSTLNPFIQFPSRLLVSQFMPFYFFLACFKSPLIFSHLPHFCWTASFFLWHCTQRIWVQDADVIEYQFQCMAARRISAAMRGAEVEEVFITHCNTGNVLHKPLSVRVSTWKCWERKPAVRKQSSEKHLKWMI